MNKTRIYKGVPVNSFGIPIFNVKNNFKKEKTNKRIFHNTFVSNINKNSPKDLIVMYDIPHEQKKREIGFVDI
jgi:hypothetical protein